MTFCDFGHIIIICNLFREISLDINTPTSLTSTYSYVQTIEYVTVYGHITITVYIGGFTTSKIKTKKEI